MDIERKKIAILGKYFGSADFKDSFDARSYLFMFGSPQSATVHLEFLHPKVTERKNGVFMPLLLMNTPDEPNRLDRFLDSAQSPLELSAIEWQWNVALLTNIFNNFDLEENWETELFADLIIHGWEIWLRGHFPSKKFRFAKYPFSDGQGVEEIRFWTDRGCSLEAIEAWEGF